MKARIKATGNIVDVEWYGHDSMGTIYADVAHITKYYEYELDFDTMYDYWTRLEHQAAIAAMHGILSNHNLYNSIIQMTQVSRVAIDYAQELIQKLKE